MQPNPQISEIVDPAVKNCNILFEAMKIQLNNVLKQSTNDPRIQDLELQVKNLQQQLELSNKKILNEQHKLQMMTESKQTDSLKEQIEKQIGENNLMRNQLKKSQKEGVEGQQQISKLSQNNDLLKAQIERLTTENNQMKNNQSQNEAKECQLRAQVLQITQENTLLRTRLNNQSQTANNNTQQAELKLSTNDNISLHEQNIEQQNNSKSKTSNNVNNNIPQKIYQKPVQQQALTENKISISQTEIKGIAVALKQILSEIGYQVQDSSDQEICLIVKQISNIQKYKLKFWKRVENKCSTSNIYELYQKYQRYTANSLAASQKTQRQTNQNQSSLNQRTEQPTIVLSLTDLNVQKIQSSTQQYDSITNTQLSTEPNIEQFVQAFRQILTEEGQMLENVNDQQVIENVQKIPKYDKKRINFWNRVAKICNIADNMQSQKQFMQQIRLHSQLSENTLPQSHNITNNLQYTINDIKSSKIADESLNKLENKVLIAFRQILKDIGYQVQNATDKEICIQVDRLSFKEKTSIKFWNRVEQMCNNNKKKIQNQYYYYMDQLKTLQESTENDQSIQNTIHTVQQSDFQDLQQKITKAFRQILSDKVKDDANDQQVHQIVEQMSQTDKTKLNFWTRVAEICNVRKQYVQTFYRTYYQQNILRNPIKHKE
ncbi:Hypothetical_protein [Hexamita inflata]|uniref:Hypothetical_protein n=1 Tax=Hexamita inflata TaxID=28002 RepID=A0AA86UJG2_9EUKA|nr:Hypothetical protein HINF_LOCUS48240 [Hexamita inflata]